MSLFVTAYRFLSGQVCPLYAGFFTRYNELSKVARVSLFDPEGRAAFPTPAEKGADTGLRQAFGRFMMKTLAGNRALAAYPAKELRL